ncbi:Carbonic anhydrase 5A, mitochondrial [Frankliniella fusca]|uniref:Carbonic anhydrase 5A, mitochondrial n=1 Tax=Frankliniella fusca TaxID=407009 RepID=A0AAE1HD63_9NEOP|nr:Carbonic anhydrase 5A, mitochondrial [Frankliniella fusca]
MASRFLSVAALLVAAAACALANTQSPINIKTSEAVPVELTPLRFKHYHSSQSSYYLANTGHGCQITLKNWMYNPKVKGGPLPKTFILEQVHFHWGASDGVGSEHHLNGNAASMEVHLVHWNSKYESYTEASTKADGLAVIGFFIECADCSLTASRRRRLLCSAGRLVGPGARGLGLRPRLADEEIDPGSEPDASSTFPGMLWGSSAASRGPRSGAGASTPAAEAGLSGNLTSHGTVASRAPTTRPGVKARVSSGSPTSPRSASAATSAVAAAASARSVRSTPVHAARGRPAATRGVRSTHGSRTSGGKSSSSSSTVTVPVSSRGAPRNRTSRVTEAPPKNSTKPGSRTSPGTPVPRDVHSTLDSQTPRLDLTSRDSRSSAQSNLTSPSPSTVSSRGTRATSGASGIDNYKNPDFQKLVNAIPKIAAEDSEKVEVNADLLAWVVPYLEESGYYTYDGSLTTSPYSENVLWIVYENPIPIGKSQIAPFRTIENHESETLTTNFRSLQSANNVVVRYVA